MKIKSKFQPIRYLAIQQPEAPQEYVNNSNVRERGEIDFSMQGVSCISVHVSRNSWLVPGDMNLRSTVDHGIANREISRVKIGRPMHFEFRTQTRVHAGRFQERRSILTTADDARCRRVLIKIVSLGGERSNHEP